MNNDQLQPSRLIESLWYLPSNLLTDVQKYFDGAELPFPIKEIIDPLEIQEVPALLKNIVHFKKEFPEIKIPAPAYRYDISSEAHQDARMVLASYYVENLRRLNDVIQFYFNVSFASSEALRKWFALDYLSDFELFPQMKESGDVEIILGYTPTDHMLKRNLGYELMEFVYALIVSLFFYYFAIEVIDSRGYKLILKNKNCPEQKVLLQLEEEEEEENFRIEIFIEEKKVTLRSLMSFQLEEETPFQNDQQDLIYHQKLSHFVLHHAFQRRLLPQSDVKLTADIYPFLVDRFLKALRRQGPIRASIMELFSKFRQEYSNRENLARALHDASGIVKDLNGLACLNKDTNHCRSLDSKCSLYEDYRRILRAFALDQN